MRKFAWLVLLSFVLTMLMGCIAARPRVAPPPLKKEVRPHKPGPNFVWIPGHWKWSGGRYVWERGSWIKPRPGMVWVPGYWQKRGPYWVWTSGHWKRR